MTPRQVGEVEAGDRRRVGERLAVMAHDPRYDFDGVGANEELLVNRAEPLGDRPRVRQLVERLMVEADRERPHGLRRCLGHGGHDG
jgi:hypothetical protein